MAIGEIVRTVLPWIGTALAGPLGGMAVEFVASKFDLEEKTVEGVKNLFNTASPEQMLLLKQADQVFALEMEKLGFKKLYDLEELSVRDRESARAREASTGDKTTSRLAGCYTLGYFAILFVAIFHGFPENNREVLLALLGILSAAQLSIISYYFGSSKGSADKTQALDVAVSKIEKRQPQRAQDN